jgi:hypothetical protein
MRFWRSAFFLAALTIGAIGLFPSPTFAGGSDPDGDVPLRNWTSPIFWSPSVGSTGKEEVRSISNAAPDRSVNTSRAEISKSSPDAKTSGGWRSIDPSPDIVERMKSAGREIEAQPGCAICMEGTASYAWSGNSGNFQLDKLNNHRSSGTSGTLRLSMQLAPSVPVFGGSVFSYQQSVYYQFANTLPAGYYFQNIDTGTITFYNSTIPAGTYHVMIMSEEFQGSSWAYTDFFVFSKMATCNGSSCTTNTSTTCTSNSTTLCLFSNRFQVTAQYNTYGSPGTYSNATTATFSDNTGFFQTVTAGNVDVVVKMVNFCSLNNTWSVYIGGTTDLGVRLTITDMNTGNVYPATNPLGTGWTLIRGAAFPCP